VELGVIEDNDKDEEEERVRVEVRPLNSTEEERRS